MERAVLEAVAELQVREDWSDKARAAAAEARRRKIHMGGFPVGVGDRVFTDRGHYVNVTEVSSNIKDGEPGFGGHLDDGTPKWGYHDQVIHHYPGGARAAPATQLHGRPVKTGDVITHPTHGDADVTNADEGWIDALKHGTGFGRVIGGTGADLQKYGWRHKHA